MVPSAANKNIDKQGTEQHNPWYKMEGKSFGLVF